MADESMADNKWPTTQFRDAWHTIYVYMYIYIHKLRNIEIREKKKRVKHLRRRNIEISEKKKHVEDFGHDVRHGYKYIYIYKYIRKYGSTFYIGIAMVV